MPNLLVQKYRTALEQQGVVDPRSDDEITTQLGQLAEQSNRKLFDDHPDFAVDYRDIREANAPSVAGEAGRAIKAGTQELASTMAGVGALATGSDYLKEKAKSFAEDAAANAPTVGTVEDIAPGETNPLRRVLSKDALRYGVAKVAGSVPSLAETLGLAAAGAAAGSAVGPEGTVVGGVEGALEGFLGKGIVKSAIRRLIANEVVPDATEASIAAAIRAGDKSLLDAVTKEATAISARRAGTATNALNMYALNAGGLYNETGDRTLAAVGGAAGALPAIVLPEIVVHKLYPGVSRVVGQQLGSQYVTRLATEALKDAGVLGSAMALQETSNIVAKNIAAGRDATAISDEDWKRIREAAIGGALTGPLAAPLTARGTADAFNPEAAKARAEAARTAAAEQAATTTPDAGPTAPALPEQPASVPPARRVALMSDEQRAARFAELDARKATLAPDEQQELTLLQAFVGERQAPAPTTEPTVPVTVTPGEPVSLGVMPEATGGAPAAPEATGPAAIVEPIPANPENSPQLLAPARESAPPEPAFPEPTTAGDSTPTAEGNSAVAPAATEPSLAALAAPDSTSAAEAIPVESAAVPVANEPGPVRIPESPNLEQRLREELQKPPGFAFGKVNEASPLTVDVREDPQFANLTPEDAAKFNVPGALDESGNKSRTRVAVVLEAPDGHYVKAGLLPPREMAAIGSGETGRGPAVQSMAAIKGVGETVEKRVKEGGNQPALLADLIRAGYKMRATVAFDEAPGKIFQRFDSRAAYDASYAATEKSTGTAAAKTIPTLSAAAGAERKSMVTRRESIQRQIDALGSELTSPETDPARAAEINDEINQRYADLAKIPEPRLMTEAETQPPLPVQSDRTNQFTAALASAQQAGLRVEVLASGILRANLADELSSRIDALSDRYMAAKPDDQPALQAQIERLQQNIDAANQVRGIAYSPWHIALGLDDVQHQNVTGIVALLHEVGHTIVGQASPEMQARITRAVNGAFADLTAEHAELSKKTGVREANLADPEELLVSTVAQRLTAEGVPEAPSLARAIVQWVKDLYYRMAMGVQAAFGREPDSQLALDWFENQLRRTVGGDYDYRFASIFDRFRPETPAQEVVRHERSGGTPGEVSDFYDPLAGHTRQPTVTPDTREGVAWNLKFMQEAADIGKDKENDIPAPEANARIMGAAINEVAAVVEKAYSDIAPTNADGSKMPFDEFWTLVGHGDTPKTLLADLEEKFAGAGTAAIGGERMTDAMTAQARVMAKQLTYKAQRTVVNREARGEERSKRAEAGLLDGAKALNKVEGNLRNADMHEATLRDDFKEMIRTLASGMKRGLDTAFAAGELAHAIRETEGLSEREAIPPEYQKVFKAVLADEVPVFHYVEAIAKLDLPLHEMTRAEIVSAIEDGAVGDPTLSRLLEARNKPLLVALTALAKKNAAQLDLIQMRAIKDPQQFLALKAKLDEIKQANPARLRELEKKFSAATKAATFADRIQQNAIKLRAKLRRQQEAIKEVEATRDIYAKMKTALAEKVEEIETSGLPAPSEWRAATDENYLAMNQDKDGAWRAVERPLAWKPDGTATNGDQILNDLARNYAYLQANPKKAGSKTYELVKRQWQELSMVDVLRKTPEIKRSFYEKLFLPTVKLLVSGGGAGAARVEQKMNRFQFLTDIKYWRKEFETSAVEWSNALTQATRAAGMKDARAFSYDILEPVRYLIQSEPGRDEGPILREAVRAARRRLTTEATPAFDEALKNLLRMDKQESEKFERFMRDNGTFVQDDRLGELRPAVARGWFTLPRSMRSDTVSTILRDMENAGWKMVFKDDDAGTKGVRKLDEGVGAGQRVVAAASFDSLLPDLAKDEADAKARTQVLENPDAFAQAISGFFSPAIVRRWLEPFINKPGKSVFTHAGEAIDPLDVQRAWEQAGGNVAKWIDGLGERVGLERNIDLDGELTHGALSLEGQWRAEMLKNIDALFLMESRLAADANQTKGLFDARGRPAHLIMDARENDLLPPEHVEHAAFDRDSSRNLLATLAFHTAFGRNGEAINRDIADIKQNLTARKAAYQDIAKSANNRADREQRAKERGYDFKGLKRAASIYATVDQGLAALQAQFGFNSSASGLADIRGGLEAVHFMAAQTTNNFKTGLLNMMQPSQRAIARGSIGPAVIRDTTGAFGEAAKNFFGSTLEAVGLNIMHASRYAADIGNSQAGVYRKFSPTLVMGTAAGRRGEELPLASRAMRVVTAGQRAARLGLGTPKEFAPLPAPVVGQMMHAIGTSFGVANGTVEARAIEGLVKAAMDHFAVNPDHLNDPTYRLTNADLAAHNRILGADTKSLDYLRRNMVAYNIGPLETVARQAMERATHGEPILTSDQALKALQISLNDVDLQSSINTNPALWDTNRYFRFFTPLLGWPIRSMTALHEAIRTERGFEPTFAQFKQAAKTIGILAAWSLPVGLAFTFLTDQYDEKVLKKKTNLGRVDPLALVPGVGAVAALATSDIPVKEQLIAIAQRLSRAGNIYGLAADYAANALAGSDPTSGQRPFTMDGRILVFSQLHNLQDALTNLYNSGFAATYANFGRPMIQALGGTGPLQAMDAVGAVLGIDNQELRIAQRTNASQWLRAAGRETGLEIRRGGGGSVAPTPTSVWTREMYLAALGNDRLDFMDAYRRAIDAERETGEQNPEAKVLESWHSRNPLDVFARRPDDLQQARMLSTMSDSGREAVQSALRLYQQYTDMIATSPVDRYEHRILSQQTHVPNMNALRAQMAGGALSFR